MDKRRSRTAAARSLGVEALDSRIVLSAAGAVPHAAVEVATETLRPASTQTTLAVHSGTLGSPITFTATVRAPASAGSPGGVVTILDHGDVLETITLSPTTGAGKSAYSHGTATLTQAPGGPDYYLGKHAVTAVFTSSGSYNTSKTTKSFTVAPPAYTPLADGAKIATVIPGEGAAIQAGQTANVLYTGYLAKGGKIFDDSKDDGGSPLSFTVGAGQVVPGFDAGTAGMQAGETRVILIPPAEGYGSTANGPIPAKSTLIFVVTLKSIS